MDIKALVKYLSALLLFGWRTCKTNPKSKIGSFYEISIVRLFRQLRRFCLI